MEYQILEDLSADALEKVINQLIVDGQKSMGGVAVVYHEWEVARKGYIKNEFIYYQAVVR